MVWHARGAGRLDSRSILQVRLALFGLAPFFKKKNNIINIINILIHNCFRFFCFEDQYVAAPIPMEENPSAVVQVERADPSAEESATEEATEGATEEATEDSTSTKR